MAVILISYCDPRSQVSIVSIATGYGPGDWGVGVWALVGSRILSSPNRPDRLCGPPKLLSNGYQGLFPRGVKQQRHEADQSPPASREVKKMWIHTSTPPYVFMAQFLICWAQGQLYLTCDSQTSEFCTSSEDLLAVFLLWFCPAFWWWDKSVCRVITVSCNPNFTDPIYCMCELECHSWYSEHH
jgi:hypothetical protein